MKPRPAFPLARKSPAPPKRALHPHSTPARTLLSSNISSPLLILLTNCRNLEFRILGSALLLSTSARAAVVARGSAVPVRPACARIHNGAHGNLFTSHLKVTCCHLFVC